MYKSINERLASECTLRVPSFLLQTGLYGRELNFFNWTNRELINTVDLGPDGIMPLEIRFLHEPTATEGFVGCAFSSTVFRFYKKVVRRVHSTQPLFQTMYR